MQATIRTATLVGVQAVPVEVQADVGAGLPSFVVVGLADAAVLEARDRVRAAMRASGFDFPNARIVVNLAPAPLRKRGTGFDLPIAAALLVATGQVPSSRFDGATVVGELGLDGSVAAVPGLLAYALDARRRDVALLGPACGAAAAMRLDGLLFEPTSALRQLRGPMRAVRASRGPVPAGEYSDPGDDLSEVAGHAVARRALEVAAAGSHNLLMVGPPGSGKTMLARRLPGILPPLSEEERLETALVHSVAGIDDAGALAGRRPFRAPHHTSSTAGLIGGGAPPRPGEVSLAHHGVLFLDELAEFGPACLQALRQPIEDGRVTLVRAEGAVRYPARFMLLAATNPCPCGFSGEDGRCRCTPEAIARYQGRIGGPLMDRVDIMVRLGCVDPERIVAHGGSGEGSPVVRQRVSAACDLAAREGRPAASRLAGAALLQACALAPDARGHLTAAARARLLSGRGVTRLLRVARTIADLAASSAVTCEHIDEALGYRFQEGFR